jgi:hypothetical protein
VKVQPVSSQDFNIDHICIKKNPDVVVEDFLPVLQAGLKRHLINSEIFVDEAPQTCQFHMSYSARHSWDVKAYLSYVKLELFDGKQLIGSAVYEHSGKFDPTNWTGTASKIDPAIDEMFAAFNPQD